MSKTFADALHELQAHALDCLDLAAAFPSLLYERDIEALKSIVLHAGFSLSHEAETEEAKR